jgi:hypothetical protein
MTSIEPGSVLELWDRALPLTPAERAVALAAAARPPAPAAEIAELPLGRRDARLLRLRSAWAAPALESIATCPSCGEQVEFAPDAGVILAEAAGASAPEPLEVDGTVVTWRLPNSTDMAAAARASGPAGAERILLDRCVTVSPAGSELSPEARAAVARAMAAADPVADVLVDLTCPACEVPFTAELDVAGIVWTEVVAHARELLREVDVLARAYGWTEAEVLGMSPQRRSAYLEMAAGS